MKLSELKRNPENPYPFKSKKEREDLKMKIQRDPEFMSLRPMVFDSENENIILGGNKRHEVLEELGYDEIPDDWAKDSKGLTEEQKRRFIFADNMNYGEWVADFVEEEEAEEWGLSITFPDENFKGQEGNGGFPYEGGELPKSHIKMVQLYLTTETHPEFMECVEYLKEQFEADSITDAVFMALKHLTDGKRD